MEEIWKDIKGYEGIYQVSNMGQIRSCDRYIHVLNRKSYFVKGKILKTFHGGNNEYRMIKLCKDNKTTAYLVHSLVIRTFNNNYDTSLEVNHKDGDVTNNCLDNLELISHLDNIHHSIKMGLTKQIGENSVLSALTNIDADEIRKLWMSGMQQKIIAEKYNVSKQTINNIVRNIAYVNSQYDPTRHKKSNKYYSKV